MDISLRRWVIYAGINLLVVSVLGALLRYKGVFGLPVVDYNYLLHAHSHFAFSGWVTTALFAGLLNILDASGVRLSRVYRYQFWLNQLSSFGMLVSFIIQGYGPVSIVFSSLSVVFSYWFAFCYWRDARTAGWPPVVRRAIGFALVYLVLSSLGPYLLAYSMSHGVGDRAFYYNAIYLYLHFQYNGWFTFGVLALFIWWAFRYRVPGHSGGGHDGGDGGGYAGGDGGGSREVRDGRLVRVFISLLGLACIPAYCLSLLWTDPPVWVWMAAAFAAVLQLAAGFVLLTLLVPNRRTWSASLSVAVKILWSLAFAAFGIKLILQAGSVLPVLGHLAFGHRSVIIAYLHLVLLGFVTLALLGFFVTQGLLDLRTRAGRMGLTVFTGGVLVNELVLFVQSLLQIFSVVWTDAGYWLFGAALLLCLGALLLSAVQLRGRSGAIQV
ncbi:MAG TPA: hypothetical protein VGS79_25360 [Puia sp.]|nr:hypothetical protein [Puia sp.]